MFTEVLLLDLNVPLLTYRVNSFYSIGDLIIAPFRNTMQIGVIVRIFSLSKDNKDKKYEIIEQKLISNVNNIEPDIKIKNNFYENLIHLKKTNDFLNSSFDLNKIKYVIEKIIRINKNDLAIMHLLQKHYLISYDEYLKTKYSFHTKIQYLYNKQKVKQIYNYVPNITTVVQIKDQSLFALSEHQASCLDKINSETKPTLIYGITGSGKTEVYFHLINQALMQDASVQILILLPEITLLSQLINRFKQRFNFTPDIWHSQVTTKKKREIYYKVFLGNCAVIVGTRSSIFLPFSNLKLIIMDEEHDDSYKQEEQMLYDTKNILEIFYKVNPNIKICLFSATPSLDSLLKVRLQKYAFAKLESRHLNIPLPNIVLIDMLENKNIKKNNLIISPALEVAIKEHIANNNQIMLYYNKRGFYRVIYCKTCNIKLGCINCSVMLVFHKDQDIFICHHCGYKIAKHLNCKTCNNELSMSTLGVEKLEQIVNEMFEGAKTLVVSSDTMKSEAEIAQNIKLIQEKKCDIIIATQILAKGHHFPSVNLVGILDIESSLKSIDIYAFEKNFQILNQVSGRAGRVTQGFVYIQTYIKDHPLIKSIIENDFLKFAKLELKNRELNNMPPFKRSLNITVSSDDELISKEFALKISSFLFKINANNHFSNSVNSNNNSSNRVNLFNNFSNNNLEKNNNNQQLKILGPTAFIIQRLKRQYRYKIIVIAPLNFNFFQLKILLTENFQHSKISIKLELEPRTFL